MSKQRTASWGSAILLMGLLQGCTILGNPDQIEVGDAADVDRNDLVTILTTDASPQSDAVGDGGAADETYGPIDLRRHDCPSPKVFWYRPDQLQLREGTLVSVASAPATFTASVGDVTVGMASLVEGEIVVRVEVLELASPASGQLAPVADERFIGEAVIPVDAAAVSIAPFSRLAEGADSLVAVVSDASGGVWNCRKPGAGDPMVCRQPAYHDVFRRYGLDGLSRLTLAPQLTLANDGRYVLELAAPRTFSAGSGPVAGAGERLGIVSVTSDADSMFSLDAAITATSREEPFHQRLALGVDRIHGGDPIALVLARNPDGVNFKPRVLVRRGPEYVEDATVAEWELSSRLTPGAENFTFLEQYQVQGELIVEPAGFAFEPGRVMFGYVGLHRDGLVFSRPGGFAGTQFLTAAIDSPAEVFAAWNLPIKSGPGRGAVIGVIHGEQRDRLTLMRWELGIEAHYIDFRLPQGLSNATSLTSGVLVAGAGVIGMKATDSSGDRVIVGLPIDAADFAASCESSN